jgi:hypothetical protein
MMNPKDDGVEVAAKAKTRVLLPWAILSIAFGLTTVLLVTDLIVSRAKEEKLSKRESLNVIGLAYGAISPIFDKTEIVLKNVVEEFKPIMDAPENGDVGVVNKRLQVLMTNLSEAQPDSLRLISADGKVLFIGNGMDSVSDISVADKSFFLKQKNGGSDAIQVSDPIKSQMTGKWLISMSKRFRKDDGSFGGMAQVFLRTDYMQEIFSKVSVGSHSGLSLVAADGGIIARSTALPSETDREYNLEPVFSSIDKGLLDGTVNLQSLIDGDTHLITYKKMRGAPMLLTVGISPDDYLNGWNKKAAYYLMSWVFVAFMMGALWKITAQNKIDKKERNDAVETLQNEREGLGLARKIIAESNSNIKRITGDIYFETFKNLSDSDGDLESWMGRIKQKSADAKSYIEASEELMVFKDRLITPVESEFLASSIFDESINKLQSIAEAKGLSIEKTTDIHPKTKVIADQGLLKKAVETLLWNATRFTNSGKIVMGIYLNEDDQGKLKMRIDLVDTGACIANEKIASVRKLLSDTQSQVININHLRLSLASKIVGIMGGEMGVHSEVNTGTNFWIIVPVGKA